MSNACYATEDDLRQMAFQPSPSDPVRWADLIPRMSRVVDLACNVEVGYFAAADEAVSVRTYESSGTKRLLVDPYVRGSIVSVEYADSDSFTPDYIEQTDRNGNYWLIGQSDLSSSWVVRYWPDKRLWEPGLEIEISARWGFVEVPADIVEATCELVIAAWRQRDAAFLRVIADVNTGIGGVSGQALPERVKLICSERKRAVPPVVV